MASEKRKGDLILPEDGDEEDKKENETEELPWGILFLVFSAIAADAITILMIQPLVYDQCEERFGMEDTAGLCAGSLIGAFTFGCTLSSFLIGYIADLYGRKKLMMLGLLTSAISINLYGFSTSFWLAFFLRLFAGLTNANGTLSSAVCADVTSGKQRVLAFGYLWGVWGFAGLFAGSIGGIFSIPRYQLFTPWGNRFWFPCFMVSCLNILSLIFIGLFLPETLREQSGDQAGEASAKERQDLQVEMTEFLEKSDDDEEGSLTAEPTIEREEEMRKLSLVEKFIKGWKVLFLSDPLRRLICSVFCVNAFANGAIVALFVLFASSPIESGGLGFSSFDAGLLLTWQSSISVSFQIFLFKRVSNLLKSNYRFYCVGLLSFILGSIFYPLSSLPSRSSGTLNPQSIFFSLFSTIFLSIGFMVVLSVLSVIQSNISPPELQGLSMGMLQSLGLFFRSFGPIISGYLLDFFAQYHFSGGAFIAPIFSYMLCYLLISRMTNEDKERAEVSQQETIEEISEEENLDFQETSQFESKLLAGLSDEP